MIDIAIQHFEDLTAKGVSPVAALLCAASRYFVREDALKRALIARRMIEGVRVTHAADERDGPADLSSFGQVELRCV